MTEGATASCPWCKAPFRPRRGGSPQRFCGSKCRTEFWIALRRWGERAISVGILTIADIKNDDPAACTLLCDPVLPSSQAEPTEQRSVPVTPSERYYTSQEELEQLMSRAIAGRRRG